MAAIVLDGVATAAAVKEELTERVRALRERGVVPGLGTLLVANVVAAAERSVAPESRELVDAGWSAGHA